MVRLEQRLKSQIIRDAEAELPNFLQQRTEWTGIVLHTSLQVRRVYRTWRDGFIFLHELHEDPEQPSQFHRHPGKMWIDLKEGMYSMDVAYDREDAPKKNEREYLLRRVGELKELSEEELAGIAQTAESQVELAEDERIGAIKDKYWVK